MNSDSLRPRPLREIEIEVEAEGREWMRQRLQQKLQQQADTCGEHFPPQWSASASPTPARHAPAQRRRRH